MAAGVGVIGGRLAVRFLFGVEGVVGSSFGSGGNDRLSSSAASAALFRLPASGSTGV